MNLVLDNKTVVGLCHTNRGQAQGQRRGGVFPCDADNTLRLGLNHGLAIDV